MSDFDLVKEAANLTDIIPTETGYKMGRHHLEQCPFCQGHDCFSIHKTGKTYKCFQCPAQGDIFDFFQDFHNLDQHEALQRAAESAGVALAKTFRQSPIRLNTPDKIRLAAANYYHGHLQHNGGKEYLTSKRGHAMATLETMKVGWTDGNLHSYLLSEGFEREDILKTGLVREKSGQLYDFFAKRLVIFPHLHDGRVLHYTIKDPAGKIAYQLPNTHRHKKWRFYNQDALKKYNELILVEGENDTLSVLGTGVKQVVGLIGQVSDAQLKALGQVCSKKQIYLWMDNDYDPENPFTKGFGYIRKICHTLPCLDVRIFIYDERFGDPDEYIQQYEGDKGKAICRLRASSVDYLTWEIMQADRYGSLEGKFDHLKQFNIFPQIGLRPEIERQIYIEKIEELGFSHKAISEQLETDGGLRKRISLYMDDLPSKRDADPNIIADMIHEYFSDNGRFFKDKWAKVWLLYNHQIYDVGTNRPFNALIKRLTRLLPTKEPGRSVWESLASEAFNTGREIELGGWLHTERSNETIFVNLNSPNNNLIKVGPTKIEEIQNGINSDHVLLKSSPKIAPVRIYLDADIEKSLGLLKRYIFDNLTCEPEQRFFVLCWLISTFLADFSPHVSPLFKAEGATASGKTTAARLLEYFLYGSDHLGEISVAGAYAEAAQSPLLVIDNLENQDLKNEMLKFLLLVATRGSKVKRKGGTESDTTQEHPKALVMITAIEPFIKTELINRTFTITFEKRFRSDSFIEDEVTKKILKHRDFMISGVLKLIQQDILPSLSDRTEYMVVLNKMFKGHSKDRTNPYLALMMLILEKVLKYWPGAPAKEDIWTSWIMYQNLLAREHEVSSNDILSLLNGLMREYRLAMQRDNVQADYMLMDDDLGRAMKYQHPDYGLTVLMSKPEVLPEDPDHTVSYIQMDFTSNDIAFAFAKFCKNNGLKNPYPSGSVFGARLANDRKILHKGGWELITRDKNSSYIKTIRGQRYFRFRHTLIR